MVLNLLIQRHWVPYNDKSQPIWYGIVNNAELFKFEREARALIGQFNLSYEAQAKQIEI